MSCRRGGWGEAHHTVAQVDEVHSWRRSLRMMQLG